MIDWQKLSNINAEDILVDTNITQQQVQDLISMVTAESIDINDPEANIPNLSNLFRISQIIMQ